MKNVFHFLVVILSFLFHQTLVFSMAQRPQSIPGKPHVLIILSDDIGFSDIEVMGSEIRTPNLKKLAENGRIFTQFYNTARCAPTRASLLTGEYPHQVGVGHLIYETPHDGYSSHLSLDYPTIAELLKDHGYHTYMSGKWHLAPRTYDPVKDKKYWPLARGFDRFYGTIAGSGSFWDPVKLCRGETYISPRNDPLYEPERFYYTDAITDNAILFLEDHFEDTPEEPFFMYMAYTAAHWPLHAPAESIAPYRGMYDDGYETVHARRVEAMRELGLMDSVSEVAPPVGTWKSVEHKQAEASLMETYAAMITRMDEGIGRVLNWLKANGESDDVIVIYLQDNGACAEDWFSDIMLPKSLRLIEDHEVQPRWGPPMQTRDGRPVRTGEDVIAGPEDTYTGYKKSWANVSNAPFRWYKHYLYEGGISTPAIISYPAAIPPRKRFIDLCIAEPVHLIDILPTILSACSDMKPAQSPGQSLWPLINADESWSRESPLFFEHESHRAVRDGRWKIVALDGQPWELYDISTDRGEMNNLAQKKPDKVKTLAAAWDNWAAESKVLPLGGWRDQERYESERSAARLITLEQGDSIPESQTLRLAGGGVRIETVIEQGPVEGVICSQGSHMNGWALFGEGDHIVFSVRQGRELYCLNSAALPKPPFRLSASLNPDGIPSIEIGNTRIQGEYWSPFSSDPPGALTAGLSNTSIGRHENEAAFQGKTESILIERLDM